MKLLHDRSSGAVAGRILIGVWAAAAPMPSTIAMEAGAEDGLGGGVPLTVRPSGFEDADAEARARQERLLSRREQNEFRFRSICTSCGTAGTKPSTLFRPIETLGGPMPSSPE